MFKIFNQFLFQKRSFIQIQLYNFQYKREEKRHSINSFTGTYKSAFAQTKKERFNNKNFDTEGTETNIF